VNFQLFKEFVSNPLFNMKVPVKLSNKFENKTFIFTGSFNTQRTLHEANVKANGGKTSSSVTKFTTYVVAGRNATAHKVASAVKLGIPVIDEETFTKML
jgi:DNA ligase (NAD+)